MRHEQGRPPHRLLAGLGDYWLAVLIVVPFTTISWITIGAVVSYLTGITLGWFGSSVIILCVMFLALFAASMVAGPIMDRRKDAARQSCDE